MEMNSRLVALIASSVLLTSTFVTVPSANAGKCASITSRDWKLISKNPSAAKGKNVWIFGKITQFDDATGTASFRANVDGINHFDGKYFSGGENAWVVGNAKTLSQYVNDDVFKACVTISGVFSYSTALTGGKLTVPKVKIRTINLLGSIS
jgi:hypothetical protein